MPSILLHGLCDSDTSISSVNRSVQRQIQGQGQYFPRCSGGGAGTAVTQRRVSTQSIRRELEQMNQYFQSFQDIIHRLHEKVGDVDEDHACVVLNENKQCQ
ncbi:MAG: hypothetical protein U0519_00440 [Candidatus Gracilibacteria bacterium]